MRNSKIMAVTVGSHGSLHVSIPVSYRSLLKGATNVEFSEGPNGSMLLRPVKSGGN